MSRMGYSIEPGFANRQGFSVGGSGQINENETILVSNFTSGDPLDVGFTIRGNPTGLINGVDDQVNLFLDGLHARKDFLIRSETAGIALYGHTGFLLDVSNNSIMATDGTVLGITAPEQVNVTSSNNTVTVTGAQVDLTANSGNINLTTSGFNVNASDFIQMTANNDSITISADDDISLTSAGLGTINLNAPNINSYSYAMPICFTRERTDTFNYTLGGQSVETVFTTDFNIPYQFVTESPQIGYTSSRWKIDFSLNCYNCSNLGDKGLALFIVFQDQASNYYLPMVYNPDTPYAKFQNAASYSSPA